ncbi:hypothetical protein [Archaeoglobus neptunius]|uniref:hypothetical protein n=1 Tax=Archaeoglobus neptunius TaxID=2798580 RepID=UPI001925F4CD|nr:hypothetical protein [Archaeoglobus neptunius]
MEIVIHLKGHCIETEAKKRYERLVRNLLREEDKTGEMERELDFLLEFLKKANFQELRKRGFDGSREIRVRVKRSGDDFIVEEI